MSASGDTTAQPCPVTFALEIFGDRWTLLVLRDVLLESRHTYKELRAANPGMATNVLADRLKRLQRRGLIEKTRDERDARQFIYRPTRLAVSVIPMIAEMIAWGSEHGDGAPDPEFVRRFREDRAALIEELQTQAREAATLS